MNKNDSEWFDDLYRRNAPVMFKLAARLLGDADIAQELVQEAFLILLYKQDAIGEHPNPDGWLLQTIKYLILNETQSARHRLELPSPELDKTLADDAYAPPLSELLPSGLSG